MNNLLSYDDRMWVTHEMASFRMPSRMGAHVNKFLRVKSHRRICKRKGVDIEEFIKAARKINPTGKEFLHLLSEWGGPDVQVVGDKDPVSYLHLIDSIIAQPNTKMIILVRDARDVVASYVRHSKDKNKPWWATTDLVQAQRTWVDSMRIIWNRTKGQDSDKILLAKYEEVAADPNKFLNDVHNFIGIEPHIVPDADYFTLVRSNIWQEEVPTLMDVATPDFKKYLKLFGYEV
jgi:hypothetical protein